MIKVEFRLEPGEDAYEHLVQWAGTMPWLDYLFQHHTDLHISKRYEPAPHLNIVVFDFELPPQKETYYNLKYR